MIDFKGTQFEKEIILWGVRWYVAYPISSRQLEEMMSERGVTVDHSTLNRWVIKYAPEVAKRFRRCQRPVGRSWRIDESVPRTHSQSAGMRCYMEDEGRPLGAGVQAQASNHLKLQW
jgi:transposase-like protein